MSGSTGDSTDSPDSLSATNSQSSVSPGALSESPPSTPSVTSYLPPCRICGAVASGFHYGANTCEACKAFFRRCTSKEEWPKPCPKGGNCKESVRGRLVCVSCRFDQCLQVGMSKSASKKGRYTHQKRTQYTNEIQGHGKVEVKTEPDIPAEKSPSPYNEDYELFLKELAQMSEASFPEFNTLMKHKALVNDRMDQLLEEFYRLNLIPEEHIYSPGPGDTQLLKPFSDNLTEAYRQHKLSEPTSTSAPPAVVNMLWDNWMQLAEFLFVQLTKYAKGLPGFNDLNIDDKVILLKAARIEISTVLAHPGCRPDMHLVGLYVGETDELLLSPIDTFPQGGFTKKFNEDHNMVMARLLKTNYNIEEVNVIMAFIVLSPDREGLVEPKKVEELQENMLLILDYVLKKNQSSSVHKNRLAETLLILPVLREHSELMRRQLYASKKETQPDLSPLIKEVL